MRNISFAALALVVTTAAQAQTPVPALKWGPAPPFFPAGSRFTVVQGDPSQAGIYTVRLDMPAGYTIKPHTHPTDEHVTVLSGHLVLGMGDEVRVRDGKSLRAGQFMTAKALEHHFAVARSRTIVQVHGQGPFVITYLDPKNDPRNAPPRP